MGTRHLTPINLTSKHSQTLQCTQLGAFDKTGGQWFQSYSYFALKSFCHAFENVYATFMVDNISTVCPPYWQVKYYSRCICSTP